VDDGSTDMSGKLCDAWAEKCAHITVIHQKNGGLSAARNTGIKNSSGSHIMLLDSDDFLDPAETDRMLSQLTDETDVLMGLYSKYYSSNNRYEPENGDGFRSLQGMTDIRDFLHVVPADGTSCIMVAWRFICRRKHLLEHDLFFLSGIYHEDEEWTQRLFSCTNRIHVTDCMFYQYRQARAGSITGSVKPKHIFDIFTIIERARTLSRNCSEACADYLKNRMASLYLNNLIHLHSLPKTERTAALQKLRTMQKDCIDRMTGRIGTPAKYCLRIFGIRITCLLLSAARKILK
jgi:glycosyltransferase involved in cell wall biosynthesis